MTVDDLLKTGRDIWADEKLSLSQIIVRLGKVFGDICRWERNASKDGRVHSELDLKKELGNLIFTTILWCDELGYNPEECVSAAVSCQIRFQTEPGQDGAPTSMNIDELHRRADAIWGESGRLTLEDFIIVLGKVYGDICRWQRNAPKDISTHTDNELQKELGNIIFSSIRCAGNLGYDPKECISVAIESQRKGFAGLQKQGAN